MDSSNTLVLLITVQYSWIIWQIINFSIFISGQPKCENQCILLCEILWSEMARVGDVAAIWLAVWGPRVGVSHVSNVTYCILYQNHHGFHKDTIFDNINCIDLCFD